jgi:hypothetical protein
MIAMEVDIGIRATDLDARNSLLQTSSHLEIVFLSINRILEDYILLASDNLCSIDSHNPNCSLDD